MASKVFLSRTVNNDYQIFVRRENISTEIESVLDVLSKEGRPTIATETHLGWEFSGDAENLAKARIFLMGKEDIVDDLDSMLALMADPDTF